MSNRDIKRTSNRNISLNPTMKIAVNGNDLLLNNPPPIASGKGLFLKKIPIEDSEPVELPSKPKSTQKKPVLPIPLDEIESGEPATRSGLFKETQSKDKGSKSPLHLTRDIINIKKGINQLRKTQINRSIRQQKSFIMESVQPKVSIRRYIEHMYESLTFFYSFGILIFLSLFLRDLWIIAFSSKETDFYCDLLVLFILGFFIVESIINSIMFVKYRFSFVFLLDTVSTLTLILDVSLFYKGRIEIEKRSIFVVRILRLLTIFKLWRATRLFFRKNQIIVYKPVTIDSLDGVMQSYWKKNLPKNEIRFDQVMYYSEGSFDESVKQSEVAELRRKKILNKKTIRYATEFPERSALSNLDNQLENESQIRKATGQGQPSLADLGRVSPRENDKRVLASFKQLENPVLETLIGDADEKQSLLHLAASQEKKLTKIKEHGRDARRYLAKNFTTFKLLSKSMLNYRLKQSGNISKTLMYTNVRNLACFLLLSNFGLSIFLTSIFTDEPKYCQVDKQIVQLHFEEGKTFELPELVESFKEKYKGSQTELIKFEIPGYFSLENTQKEMTRRMDEVIVCEDRIKTTESISSYVSMIVWLDNRFYNQLNSMMNILRNLVIILILVVNIIGVNRDTKNLILKPMDALFTYVAESYPVHDPLHQPLQTRTTPAGKQAERQEDFWSHRRSAEPHDQHQQRLPPDHECLRARS